MLNSRAKSIGRRQQAGMSIVELMVGVTIGLIIVAAASLLMSTQLVENRKLLTETQLQQDLRATADIMTRELRRAGALPEVAIATVPAVIETVWTRSMEAQKNTLNAAAVATSAITFKYASAETVATVSQSQFRLTGGVIETLLPGSATPQALTDTNVMEVTDLTVSLNPTSATVVRLPCPNRCPDTTTDCWPTFQVREIVFEIQARARRDASVKRAIRSHVRVRNDDVIFTTAAGAGGNICPA